MDSAFSTSNLAKPVKIALTGGPCAGKTSCLQAVENRLGKQAVMVPEASTLVLARGWRQDLTFLESPAHRAAFQQEILQTQKQLEAQAEQTAAATSAAVIVCDRGFLDGAAYWPEGREDYLRYYDLQLEECFQRYQMVIHLESLAVSQPKLYGGFGNTQRYENLQGALHIENAVRQAWRGHPCWTFVPSDGSLEDKADRVLEIIQDYLEGA